MEKNIMNNPIPDYTMAALRWYIDEHIRPGGFLYAVLCNNLDGAFARADDLNREALFEIVSYLHNEVPLSCWGSPQKVEAYLRGR